MQIGVLQTRVKNFSYNELPADELIQGVKVQSSNVEFSDPNLTVNGAPKDTATIALQTSMSLATKNFKSSAVLYGVFQVPKEYADATASKNADKDTLEKVRKLLDELLPIIVSKLQLYTGVFSLETNTYPIMPKLRAETDGLQQEKQ
ncbi:hypothetical protein [Lactiplantibacillus plantarum]|uniref:hypothetical protein n=1 Tax=Lactiplantibacillus plantarum TaxID=1590 RepID=UPI0026535B1A|nr:hypothetical protein [Lactiplantibacillus plantarum]MDN7033871.1 hypothetical protein [Lactiplantibacillus plantarum]